MRSGNLFIAFIVLTISLSVFAGSPLVAHWPLDGNALDISGNGLDGIAVNGPVWSAEGYIDGCVVLDGVDDYIEITGYKGITGYSSRTCTAWVKTTQASCEIMTWGSEEGNGKRWIIRVNEGGQLRVEVQGGNMIGTTPINDGNWHHIAVVLPDSGIHNIVEARLYVDGHQEDISAYVEEPVNTGAEQDVRIGMYNISQRYFNGSLDDVRIYDTAFDDGQIQAMYAGFTGTGTPGDPYQISTPEELIAIGSNAGFLDKSFVLMNDIIFDPVNNPAHVFTEAPIAPYRDSASPSFSGHFDGAGYRVVNLEIQGADGVLGLFGRLKGTNRDQVFVENLTIENPMISGGDSYIGALAGWVIGGKVDSCHVIGGSVNEPTASVIGGLLGAGDVVEVSHCTSSAEVTGVRSVGGLVGAMGSSAIYDSSSSGNVYGGGSGCMGGLVGWWWGLEMVDLPEDAEIGVFESSSSGNVISSGGECGGLMGHVTIGVFENCSATGTVNGTSLVGGLIGSIELNQGGTTSTEGPTIIQQCFSTADVQASGNYVGGLVGRSRAILVKDCYATGDVQSSGGYDHVGGLLGLGGGMVARSFSTGLVEGSEPSGGLIAEYGDTYLCYWDTETSQMTESSSGIGKTAAEMMSMETYRGWGDEVWVLDEGHDYPHLAWEGTIGTPITDGNRMYSGGDGTPENPYQMSTVDDLISLGWYCQDWDNCFELANDIVLDSTNLDDPNVIYPNANFNKIGVRGLPFTGNWNGKGFSITNITNKNMDGRDNGLFGYIIGDGPDDVVVENLRIIHPALAGISCHGGLAGCLESGRVERCGVEGFSFSSMISETYSGASGIGGLLGYADNAVVSRCYADGSVFNLVSSSSGGTRGGLIGAMNASQVEDCYAVAAFNKASSFDGGIVGEAWSSSNRLSNCYAVPSVSGYTSITRIVGSGDAKKLYCYLGLPSDSWMKERDHFNYWDFVGESRNGVNEIWRMCRDGVDYPRLSWEFAQNGDFACGDGVGMPDLIALAESWLTVEAVDPAAFNYSCDADLDGAITLNDFAVLSENYGPSFDVSVNTLSFSTYQDGDNPASQSFTIINSNLTHLDWSIDVDSLPSWLTVSPTSGSLELNGTEELTVSIDVTGLPAGEHHCPIVISDLSGNGLSQTVMVDLELMGPKLYIWIASDLHVLNFEGYEGFENPDTKWIRVENNGGGTLDWHIETESLPAWLSVNKVSGQLARYESEYVTVSIDTSGLASGQYTYDLVFSDPNATNSPQLMPVVLNVLGPEIGLYSTVTTYIIDYISITTYETLPVNKLLKICNIGGGTLNWNVDLSDQPEWLISITPTSGSLERGGQELITLTVNPDDLPAGQYSHTIYFVDPNASNNPCPLSIDMFVSQPQLSISDTTVDILGYEGALSPVSQIITISNPKGGTLNWSADLTDKPDWLSVSPISGSLMHNEEQDMSISADLNSLTAGNYNYSFEVADPNATVSPRSISVSLNVAGPSITVSGNVFNFSALEGGANPTEQILEVTNSGGGTLSWNIDDTNKPDWLILTPTGGSITHNESQNVTVSIDSTDLTAGQYSYSFQVSDQNATNSPKTISVNLEIIGPSLELSETTLSFNGSEGATNPLDQSITVTNTEGGVLDWSIGTSGNPEWLTITPLSGNLLHDEGEEIVISVDISNLSIGSYTYAFEICDIKATGSPKTVNINLLIGRDTLVVPDDFSTIQIAIDAVEEGGVVTLLPGTYYENINFKGKNCILTSTDPNDSNIVENTIIDGSSANSVIRFNGTETADCVLRGLTITNGMTASKVSGGGISGSGTEVTIERCIIRENMTGYAGYGAGIYQCNGVIRDCIITQNSTGSNGCGAGLSNCMGLILNCVVEDNVTSYNSSGAGLHNCSGTIQNCEIKGNSANRGSGGGLYHCEGTVIDCRINNNYAATFGGGLYHCDANIYNCTISDNISNGWAGGLSICNGTIKNCLITGNSAEEYAGGLRSCNGEIENCIISNNTATQDGGGLYDCNGLIRNCIISGNVADEDGGGLYGCHGDILNCTVFNNSAKYGGGIGGYTPISNSIIWGNVASSDGDQMWDNSAPLVYCCIQDWTGGGLSNITSDPMFVDTSSADPANWDLHLLPGSGCIDTGTNSPTGGLPVIDLDWNPRPVDGDGNGTATADMGAYEYQL